jgi:hypothetical protein
MFSHIARFKVVVNADLTFSFIRSLRLGRICDVDISFPQKLSTLEFLDFLLAEVSLSDTEYSCCPLPRLKTYAGFTSHIPALFRVLPSAMWMKCSTLLKPNGLNLWSVCGSRLSLLNDSMLARSASKPT